jgi:hypothetical protein
MNTLQEIGKFIGIPQGSLDVAGFGGPSTTSLRNARLLVTNGERSSMQAVIQALKNLTPITLEAQIVGNRSGEAPFATVIRLNACGAIPWRTFILFSPTSASENLRGAGGDFTSTQLGPGIHQFVVQRSGISNTGFVAMSKVLDTITVSARPQPPTPKPSSAKFHFAVINQSSGHFRIAGVTWTVWHQTVSGFTLLSTVNGESVTLPQSANGQYQVHADVAVTRLETGLNELAEFRGNAIGPGGAVTLVIMLDGIDQSRTFRLLTESQTADTGNGLITIHNPVVAL